MTAEDCVKNGTWYAKSVGIIAMEIYFPAEFVEQSELEEHDGVAPGKYTIGLGQTRLAVSSDVEDIQSIALTATQNLIDNTGVSPKEIGFLTVGTESMIDKSKSVKSTLMQLFEESENYDIQGVDQINACFGGTAALYSALDWVESSSWDGRYAIVVCGDIAVYAEGPARPTSGAGCVAMLIGENAAIEITRGSRVHYMRNAYDFYKPNLSSPYPVVNGQLSVECYMEALINCYQSFRNKVGKKNGNKSARVQLKDFKAMFFHAPYCKIVQKGVTRMELDELQSDPVPNELPKFVGAEKYLTYSIKDTFKDREFDSAFGKYAAPTWENKVKPYLTLNTELGNMYTASLYASILSFIMKCEKDEQFGSECMVFAYGSGLASSIYGVKLSTDKRPDSPLRKMQQRAEDIKDRLAKRIKITPTEFVKRMKQRELDYGKAPFKPSDDVDTLYPGTYYLVSTDDQHRRTYARKPL